MPATKGLNKDEVKRRFTNGESFAQIAKLMGVTSTAVRECLVRQGLVQRTGQYAAKITPEVAETIKKLVAQEMIVVHIAKEVGISPTGVRAFLKKEGISAYLAPPPDRSRPCQRCGTVFSPKCSDGPAKEKYKFCSPACVSAHFSDLKTVYDQGDIQKVIRLKKELKTIGEIIDRTGVARNKIKEITKDEALYVPKHAATKNAQEAKTRINSNHMADMRECHMEFSHEEFYSRVAKVEKDIMAGKGTASGLAGSYGLQAPSVAAVFRNTGKSHLLMVKESTPQRQIHDFVKGLAKNIRYNDRKVIMPFEIDIYLPDKAVGIEFCGLYWHSEKAGYERRRHHDKMLKCEAEGIRLLTIFEDEWYERRSQVEGYIKSVLGVNSRSVFARKTEVRKLDKMTARDFLNLYHIQGGAHTEVEFGLYLGDELLAVVTGAKHHRQGNDSIFVLNRLAFKSDVTIVGGASRLVKALKQYAKEQGYSVLRTWSDNRWSQGNVYGKVGFDLVTSHGPDYYYVKQMKRVSKQACQKAQLEKRGGIGLTETEMAKSLGYYRIWDCGKKTWQITL